MLMCSIFHPKFRDSECCPESLCCYHRRNIINSVARRNVFGFRSMRGQQKRFSIRYRLLINIEATTITQRAFRGHARRTSRCIFWHGNEQRKHVHPGMLPGLPTSRQCQCMLVCSQQGQTQPPRLYSETYIADCPGHFSVDGEWSRYVYKKNERPIEISKSCSICICSINRKFRFDLQNYEFNIWLKVNHTCSGVVLFCPHLPRRSFW